ncbi:MAG: D-glycero-alpha-D-manno-heptose-1,7-bisphosphate 7-phosphatase [Planctomycetota bacterium]
MRAVFLDRDGVINRYRGDHVRSARDFEYYEFAEEAFRMLAATGLPIVVITNQSAIGRGYTTEGEVMAIHKRLARDAARWGAPIAAIEHCPHTPAEDCRCRKPEVELFERAAERLSLTLAGSFMVGDAPADVEAGHRLGMTTLRVATGRGGERLPEGVAADWQGDDLLAAARWIAARCR